MDSYEGDLGEFGGKCAEINVIDLALKNYKNVYGAKIKTVQIGDNKFGKHGCKKPACPVCSHY